MCIQIPPTRCWVCLFLGVWESTFVKTTWLEIDEPNRLKCGTSKVADGTAFENKPWRTPISSRVTSCLLMPHHHTLMSPPFQKQQKNADWLRESTSSPFSDCYVSGVMRILQKNTTVCRSQWWYFIQVIRICKFFLLSLLFFFRKNILLIFETWEWRVDLTPCKAVFISPKYLSSMESDIYENLSGICYSWGKSYDRCM